MRDASNESAQCAVRSQSVSQMRNVRALCSECPVYYLSISLAGMNNGIRPSEYLKGNKNMRAINLLDDIPFNDVKNVDHEFYLRPGVYTPFDSFLMYPGGLMP